MECSDDLWGCVPRDAFLLDEDDGAGIIDISDPASPGTPGGEAHLLLEAPGVDVPEGSSDTRWRAFTDPGSRLPTSPPAGGVRHSRSTEPRRSGAMPALPPGMWQLGDSATATGAHDVARTTVKTRQGTQRLFTTRLPKAARCGLATTIMLRNLPDDLKRGVLTDLLDRNGLMGTFNFVYVPTNFRKGGNILGYALVNFVDHAGALEGLALLAGFTMGGRAVVCEWSNSIQGLSALVERYRNSPVMHPDVPECYQPMLLSGSRHISFPAPNIDLRRPVQLTNDASEADASDHGVASHVFKHWWLQGSQKTPTTTQHALVHGCRR